jgi:hypothetical protein
MVPRKKVSTPTEALSAKMLPTCNTLDGYPPIMKRGINGGYHQFSVQVRNKT